MADDSLFRIALAPSAFLIWARCVTWPLFTVGLCVLLFFKRRPASAWTVTLVVIQRGMVGVAIVLASSLLITYLAIPDADKQIGLFWYGALLGSLPVFIPSLGALFLAPVRDKEDVVKTNA